MRPHNSGHWTIEGARTSQFEQHLRAVLDLPLGDAAARRAEVAMANVFGGDGATRTRVLAGMIHVMAADPGAKVHFYGKAARPGRKIGHVTVLGDAAEDMAAGGAADLRAASCARQRTRGPVRSRGGDRVTALVGVVMGSDSDWPVMEAAADARWPSSGSPARSTSFPRTGCRARCSRTAPARRGRGLRVIIAGAGGAAHLPGMLAAVTPLPVIGVPVPLKHLDGLDSLLSIVQMPAGVPVAAVAVGGARNAGLLAVRILGAGDPALREQMTGFQADLRATAQAKGAALRDRLPSEDER